MSEAYFEMLSAHKELIEVHDAPEFKGSGS